MADTIVQDVVSKADFASAQKEIAELRTRLEAANETKFKEQIVALEKAVASKDEEIKNIKTEVDNVKASKKEVETTLASTKTEVENLTKKLTEADSKLEEHTKAVVKANRISALVEKGVDKAEAEKIVTAALAASDELFATIVETQAKLIELAKVAAAAAPADDKEKDKKKKEKEKEAAKADEQKLDDATTDDDAPLSTDASTDEETDSVIAGLADFLAQEVAARKSK